MQGCLKGSQSTWLEHAPFGTDKPNHERNMEKQTHDTARAPQTQGPFGRTQACKMAEPRPNKLVGTCALWENRKGPIMKTSNKAWSETSETLRFHRRRRSRARPVGLGDGQVHVRKELHCQGFGGNTAVTTTTPTPGLAENPLRLCLSGKSREEKPRRGEVAEKTMQGRNNNKVTGRIWPDKPVSCWALWQDPGQPRQTRLCLSGPFGRTLSNYLQLSIIRPCQAAHQKVTKMSTPHHGPV